MTEALGAVLDHAFGSMGLHRVEANVMPANERSVALVRKLGFRDEGTSMSYLRIQDRWEDHIRLVILKDEWRRT